MTFAVTPVLALLIASRIISGVESAAMGTSVVLLVLEPSLSPRLMVSVPLTGRVPPTPENTPLSVLTLWCLASGAT